MRFKGTIEQLQKQSWKAREKRHSRKLTFSQKIREMEDMFDIDESKWKDWKRIRQTPSEHRFLSA